ncbi:MAG: hypothetical protein R3F08_06180 [Dokdonella sp.]|nr:hypothetical protein [Dokdonella sp.]
MARPLRVEFAGALYHVTSRGDRREDIYLDDGDREMFLEVLAEVCDRSRDRDLADIRALLRAQRGRLNMTEVREYFALFERPDLLDELLAGIASRDD